MRFRISQADGFPLLKVHQRNVEGGYLSPLQFRTLFAFEIRTIDENLLRTVAGQPGAEGEISEVVFPTEKGTAQTQAKGVITTLRIDGEGQDLMVGAIDHRALKFVGGDAVSVATGPVGGSIGKVFDQSAPGQLRQFF